MKIIEGKWNKDTLPLNRINRERVDCDFMCGVSLFLVGLDMPAVTFVQIFASFIGQVVGAHGTKITKIKSGASGMLFGFGIE